VNIKIVLVWILRIATMPIRLFLAFFIASAVFCVILPIALVFICGNPESAIDAARDLFDPYVWKQVAKMVIFGIT
jgi:hypothetical protein